MKRTLIALALAGLTLGANVATADSYDITLDSFWQRNEATAIAPSQSSQEEHQPRKYEQVDGYNG